MWTVAIVKVDITPDRLPRLADTVERPQIHLLVFDAAPQPFNKHIIPPSPFTVHADRDLVADEHAGEGATCKLRTLIGVEDLRLAMLCQSFFQRLDAERCLHRDRQPPRQHAARRPVEHGCEIHKAARHRNVRDAHRPDLVGPRDGQAAQQIRIDLVAR